MNYTTTTHMQKPKAPKRPAKHDVPPTKTITVTKILVFDNNAQKYMLIDEVNQPSLVYLTTDTMPPGISPVWEELDDRKLSWLLENLSYNQQTEIRKQCDIPSDDFIVRPHYNDDGDYDFTSVQYDVVDPDYQKKLDAYNDRYAVYHQKLKQYETQLTKYNAFKKEERKRKLQEELKRLQ